VFLEPSNVVWVNSLILSPILNSNQEIGSSLVYQYIRITSLPYCPLLEAELRVLARMLIFLLLLAEIIYQCLKFLFCRVAMISGLSNYGLGYFSPHLALIWQKRYGAMAVMYCRRWALNWAGLGFGGTLGQRFGPICGIYRCLPASQKVFIQETSCIARIFNFQVLEEN
jgi:hypothetical protein